MKVGNTGGVLGGIAQRQQILVPRLQSDGRAGPCLALALLLLVVGAWVAIPENYVREVARVFTELQHSAVVDALGTAGGYPLQCIADHRRAKVVLPDGAVVILPGCAGRSHENCRKGRCQDTAHHCAVLSLSRWCCLCVGQKRCVPPARGGSMR